MRKHGMRFVAILLCFVMAMGSFVMVRGATGLPPENPLDGLVVFDLPEDVFGDIEFWAADDDYVLYDAELQPFSVPALPGGITLRTSTARTTARPINRNITAAEVVAGMGAGWNLGNRFDARAHSETQWVSQRTTRAHIQEIHRREFNAIRIPVTWTVYRDTMSSSSPATGQKGHTGNNWEISRAFLARVEEVVGWAYDLGMYVLINSHHDDTVQLRMVSNASRSDEIHRRIWRQVATYFNNQFGERLIFAGSNEPRVDLNNFREAPRNVHDAINRQHQIFVDEVRATGGNNRYRVLGIMPHAASGMAENLAELRVPNDPARPGDSSRIVLHVHTYSPHDFAFRRATNRSDFRGVPRPANPGAFRCQSHNADWWCHCTPERIHHYFDNIERRANALGLPVILSEWGSEHKNNTDARIRHATYYVTEARRRGWPTFWWDNTRTSGDGERFGLFNPGSGSGSWHFPALRDAIIAAANAPPPAPIFSISLSQTSTLTFPSAAVGYPQFDWTPITVTNTGNRPTGPLTINTPDGFSIQGRTQMQLGIPVGQTQTFDVRPSSGLPAGTHTATISVSGGNGITTRSFGVSFTVTGGATPPPAPTPAQSPGPSPGQTPGPTPIPSPAPAIIFDMQTDANWENIRDPELHPIARGVNTTVTSHDGPPRELRAPVRNGTSQGLRLRASALLAALQVGNNAIQIVYTGRLSEAGESQIRLESVAENNVFTQATSGSGHSFTHTVALNREQLQATIAASENGDITLGATPGTAGLTITGIQISVVPAVAPQPTPSPQIDPTPTPPIDPTPTPPIDPTPTPPIDPTPTPPIDPTPTPPIDPTPTPPIDPTPTPSLYPTPSPPLYPTPSPSLYPTPSPSLYPTPSPSLYPTPSPSLYPTPSPSLYPTPSPSLYPTPSPSIVPTPSPGPTITFNANGGVFASPESPANPEIATRPANEEGLEDLPRAIETMFSKPGYRFMGWYYGTTRVTDEFELNGSVVFTAQWVRIENPSDFAPGNVNGDAYITSADATAIARHITDNTPRDFCELAADINGDGTVCVEDITLLARLLVGQNVRHLIAQ